MNWKVRFQNKTWLLTFIAAILGFLYQIFSMLGVVPAVSENDVMGIFSMAVNVLVLLGVVTDPTTQGLKDSERAMTYQKPGGEEEDVK